MKNIFIERVLCLVCNNLTYAETGVCKACTRKGYCCNCCGELIWPNKQWMCDKCREILRISDSYVGKRGELRDRLNEPFIQKYSERADQGIELFNRGIINGSD